MIIERPLELGQPRRKVWCLSTEITNNNNGTYSFVNLPNEDLGFGSKIFVVDVPNLILYFDNESGLLYPWTEATPYVLPIASDSVLGGIKVGEGLYINSNGVLSVSGTGTLVVGKATEILSTAETTKTVSFNGSYITAYATMGLEQIDVDITFGENVIIFSVAEAPSDNIICTVIYGVEE